MYDVIIVGAGPAGLSAALYTCRANLSTLVIGKDGGTLERVDLVENYFGFSEPVSGPELLENTRKLAVNLGAEIIEDEVLDISWMETFFATCKNQVYESKTVLLATGSSRVKANIPGIKEHEGKGVSYCAVCDAFFYRGKDVVVLGSGDYALHECMQLRPVAGSVTLCTNGKIPEISIPEGISVRTEEIASIDGDGAVSGLTFVDGSKMDAAGVFVALGSAGAVDLAKKMGAVVEGNAIAVDTKMAANVPGLFAAGDCIGGLLQISTAVGEGAQAAMSAIAYARRNR